MLFPRVKHIWDAEEAAKRMKRYAATWGLAFLIICYGRGTLTLPGNEQGVLSPYFHVYSVPVVLV